MRRVARQVRMHIMRRIIRRLAPLAIGCTLVLMLASTVAAAPNPSGTGQPSVSCGSANATASPNGFATAGFAHAETVYAGTDGSQSAAHAGSGNAVSQYDVACYQQTANH